MSSKNSHEGAESSDPVKPTSEPTSPLPPLPTKLTTLPSPIDGRLDTALRAMYALSHKAARRLITTHKVSVNGVVHHRWETEVDQGALVTINPAAPNLSKQSALGAHLVFQDDAFAVLNKPAGLLSAPQRDSDEPSALQAASRLCRGPRRPRVVHRLDKETSGLLIFARTIPATRALQAQLQERDVKRVYRCIVRGELRSDQGYLSSWLIRDAGKGRRGSRAKTLSHTTHRPPTPSLEERAEAREARERSRGHQQPQGQWALTHYRVIARQRGYSALEVELFTGRTHQIRIHLAEHGHPIVGEWVYGPRVKREPRLALHAARLELTHPFSEKRHRFEAPWPDDLRGHAGVPRAWVEPQPQRVERAHDTPERSPSTSRQRQSSRGHSRSSSAKGGASQNPPQTRGGRPAGESRSRAPSRSSKRSSKRSKR